MRTDLDGNVLSILQARHVGLGKVKGEAEFAQSLSGIEGVDLGEIGERRRVCPS